LIERPDYWPRSLDDWCTEYERRLPTLLRAMKAKEDQAFKDGRLNNNQRLSDGMADSWESGDFWISYAARQNFAFDLIYWHKIDARFFGRVECPIEDVWKGRLALLTAEERVEIEGFVAIKVEEMKTRVLAWDPHEYTKELVGKGVEGDDASKEGEHKQDVEDSATGDPDTLSTEMAELSV